MRRNLIRVDPRHCTGCARCVRACPFDAVSMRRGKAVIDHDICTLCGACASVCPMPGAIAWEGASATAETPTCAGDIWVYCEQMSASTPAPVSLELLEEARTMADTMGAAVQAVLLGPCDHTLSRRLIACGADRVRLVTDSRLDVYQDETYANVIARILAREKPGIFLGGATAIGRALMPRIAVMLHTGLTADCTALAVDPQTGILRQTRPAFGGNILATITCETHRPQMATVRPGVFSRPPYDPDRKGRVEREPVVEADLSTASRLLSFAASDMGTAGLQEAEVVVTAGYGVGGPEGIEMVRRLSEVWGGALGASRAVVDAGWLPYTHQIGQTGTTVQPRLYVACGLSGAIQHVVGMQKADKVVAVNRDPDAPIFSIADYGIVGDVREIIPALIQAKLHTQKAGEVLC